MLVFAPLMRGGNRPLPLLVLECLALAGLAAIALGRAPRDAWTALTPPLRWGLAILFVFPLAQLLPLPGALWSSLPGHDVYARVLEHAGGADEWRPLTLHARATEYSWLAMLPPIAMLLVVAQLGPRQVRALVLVFVTVAIAESFLGILQVGSSRNAWTQLGNPHAGNGASGTYVNRNHFAGLLVLALPILVAVWAAEALPGRDAAGAALREHPRHADRRLARRILWSLAVALVLAALLFTRSRAGIFCGLAGFGAASLAMVWGTAGRGGRVALGLVAVIAFALAAYAGLTPVLDRFAPDELALGYDGRALIAAATLRAGVDFVPFGSGLGTFADVFTRYQPEGVRGLVDYAHNDYAQAFLELGIAGIVALALLGIAYGARWRALSRGGGSRRVGNAQLAAGISLAALAVHGAFDFNFHIPANALYFAFLAGVFAYEARG